MILRSRSLCARTRHPSASWDEEFSPEKVCHMPVEPHSGVSSTSQLPLLREQQGARASLLLASIGAKSRTCLTEAWRIRGEVPVEGSE
jgi:hypothetical protein